jgi:hypothetical protein
MLKYLFYICAILSILTSCSPTETSAEIITDLHVSENGRFFETQSGAPFFWLGDTGWLLFKKMNREEADFYLENRRSKGFNVVQVMLLHELSVTNFQGDSALVNKDISASLVTEGTDPGKDDEYDYWDHVDYIVDLAAQKGIFIALVPVWGSPVSAGDVSEEQAKSYAIFLAERFREKKNIIWMNGGDVVGDTHMPVWLAIGNTIDSLDNKHLITYHPRGRRMSSEWFHNEKWLDFNTFQSGHRNYLQDTASDSYRFGPSNWKYVNIEYNLKPIKPTFDAEPSYEEIPQGLHDTTEVYWNDADVRRYAYWSVFAGGAGFTYGHNSVMQFYRNGEPGTSYGPKSEWKEALNYPGASQMIHLKNLMLSKPYFARVPDQSIIADQGENYEYQVATRGNDYVLVYTYTGRDMTLNLGKIYGERVKASWYDPRNGTYKSLGSFANEGKRTFDCPDSPTEGNDWVLVLESL